MGWPQSTLCLYYFQQIQKSYLIFFISIDTLILYQVENELPEKIERLVRCDASAYQKLLMKRVDDNLGSLGNSKVCD